jgi:DNA-binding NarL/FixJ family response regulator
MDAFRILVVDRHPIFCLGLREVLGAHDGWEVCGEAVDGPDAAEKCMRLKPDLMILEICMARLNGIDVVRQILQAHPTQRILVLTDADSEKAVRHCLLAGVCGWILKSDGIADLTIAVKAVQHNGAFGSRTPAVLVRGRWKANPGQSADEHVGHSVAKPAALSPREQEVLQLVAEGRSSKDVAAILKIAEKTAVTHRTNLMTKLDLHSVAKLVVYAVRNEVIPMPFSDGAEFPEGGLPAQQNLAANISLQSL